MGRHLAIADIHGCKQTFAKLLKVIDLAHDDTLYLLGDMINRGPDSGGVIDKILKLQLDGYHIVPLRGNHEQLLSDILKKDSKNLLPFLRYYHSETLLNKHLKIKEKYRNFIHALPYYKVVGDCILVHGGLDLRRSDIFDNKEFMLYAKSCRGRLANLRGRTLVHGHAVTQYQTICDAVAGKEPILSIDNGCVLGATRQGYGKLVCLNLDSMEITAVQNCDYK